LANCPTSAFESEYVLNANKCISYLTIEKRGDLSEQERGMLGNWIFGCDICQDVCPWNKFSKPHQEPLFNPIPEVLAMTKKDWQEITEDIFQSVFKNSPLKRVKFDRLKKNTDFLSSS
jgi:epoxyqueuosine reductase